MSYSRCPSCNVDLTNKSSWRHFNSLDCRRVAAENLAKSQGFVDARKAGVPKVQCGILAKWGFGGFYRTKRISMSPPGTSRGTPRIILDDVYWAPKWLIKAFIDLYNAYSKGAVTLDEAYSMSPSSSAIDKAMAVIKVIALKQPHSEAIRLLLKEGDYKGAGDLVSNYNEYINNDGKVPDKS